MNLHRTLQSGMNDTNGVLAIDQNDLFAVYGLSGQVALFKSKSTKKSHNKIVSLFNVKGPVNAAKMISPNFIAVGGVDNDIQCWDLNNSESPSWAGRNVPNDKLSLSIPINITAITSYAADIMENNLIATGTALKQVFSDYYDC